MSMLLGLRELLGFKILVCKLLVCILYAYKLSITQELLVLECPNFLIYDSPNISIQSCNS